MPVYRLTYRPGLARDPEDVEADSVTTDSTGHVVLRATVFVIGQPREVVIRRVPASDLTVSEGSATLGRW